MRLVLASQSPRRRELLERAGFSFLVSPSQISEILDENLNLGARIEDLAHRKALAWRESRQPADLKDVLVLSADTVVVIDDEILGKPNDQNENLAHLRRLSGREHQVITAVCLVVGESGDFVLGHGLTRVRFRDLRKDEIASYAASGEGLDKAGGYGVQGEGRKFVAHLDGDFDNVMGLPIRLVEALLASKNWVVERQESSKPERGPE